MPQYISARDVAGQLNWTMMLEAFAAGHQFEVAEISDTLLGQGDLLLSRSAWIKGLGIGVKSVTIFPENGAYNLPSVQGAMTVFEDKTGQIEAILESDLVTNWKTAGDSVYGASLLARPDSQSLLIIGAGVVAENLIRAYSEVFLDLKFIQVWNRTPARADALVTKMTGEGYHVTRADDLAAACQMADIISTATMAKTPVIKGDWVTAGTHVDLIGAFTPDMREADDALMAKGRIFVDSRATTIHEIGELMIPIASGVISETDVIADYYDIAAGAKTRQSEGDITILKNGGGAHLDLMTAKAIMSAQNRSA
ncbi:MAG: ornithine cyclodeaminase family protein [Halocynthiibacter sp.]